MRKIILSAAGLLTLLATMAFGQSAGNLSNNRPGETPKPYTYWVSTTWLSFANFGDGRTNTHHYEVHLKYARDQKNIIGLKLATWRLFQPMGILWWDGLLDKIDSQSEFYPGHVRETGLGLTYQRMVWKGLFTTVEVLPQLKTYLNENGGRIGNGFKLYTSYHLGYHVSLFKGRMYIEPQVHCQYWPVDTGTPEAFKAKDNRWRNYFLFEPNIYLGIKF